MNSENTIMHTQNRSEHSPFEGAPNDQLETSVYESRFVTDGLPRVMIPKETMPKATVYRLIKDHIHHDSNPTLNLGTFVSTYMEEEAEMLIAETSSKNFIDYKAYPQTFDVERRCVNMVAELFHAPSRSGNAVGTSTIGSSEAIMLSMLAMKHRWIKKRIGEGNSYSKPNMIMNAAVQVCWKKAALYFDIEIKFVYCTKNRYVMDPQEAISLVDENTIGIGCIFGTTYTGHYEDVKAINDLLNEKNLDIPIHVDAASGGFIAPFVTPEIQWDFRLDKVVSINVSGHKYGLVYAGIGWVIWRSPEYLPKELIFNINYLGLDQPSFTLNFSKSGSHILAQYYQFVRLGKDGYREIMQNIIRTADHLAKSLENLGFVILSGTGGSGLPLVAFRLGEKQNCNFDEFSLSNHLGEQGWFVPAYHMAANAEKIKLLRIVCRNDFSRAHCDNLVADISRSMNTLRALHVSKSVIQTPVFSEPSSTPASQSTKYEFSINHQPPPTAAGVGA